MPKRPTARDLEAAAAAAGPPRPRRDRERAGEAAAMIARRGFRPTAAPLDLPFPPDLDEERADRLAEKLGHYAFRLFLRGAIQHARGFFPRETTRYLQPAQARVFCAALEELGLASRLPRGRYRLVHPARSFGGTLEWYVARELRRLGFDVEVGLKFRAREVGGDLDVVAAAEGKLVYVELKSSPPRHLQPREVAAFFKRLRALHPDLALFVMDTALRLSDRVVPLLQAELLRRRQEPLPVPPRRVERELWAVTPHLYAVNAKPDLVSNVSRAIAEGLRALAPPLP